MKLSVRVKTNAKKECVTVVDGVYTVSVKALPIDGKANSAIEKLLAQHFNVAPSLVRVVSGNTARQKIIEVQL